MKEEEQRIAIAEACQTMKWSYALPEKCIGCDVPDYLNCLNECHIMESILKPDQINLYCKTLLEVMSQPEWAKFHAIHATARQRCEAFLKTLNLWKD